MSSVAVAAKIVYSLGGLDYVLRLRRIAPLRMTINKWRCVNGTTDVVP